MLDQFSLTKKASNIAFPTRDNYLTSYPKILSHFNKYSITDPEDVILNANLVYGWMPTTFKIKEEFKENIDSAINNLQLAKEGKELSKNELLPIKKVINNSIVGASKFLHFLNPELYPIWDSKICEVCLGTNSYYTIQKLENYIHYRNTSEEKIKNPTFDRVYQQVTTKLNQAGYSYSITKMRAFELILFQSASE